MKKSQKGDLILRNKFKKIFPEVWADDGHKSYQGNSRGSTKGALNTEEKKEYEKIKKASSDSLFQHVQNKKVEDSKPSDHVLIRDEKDEALKEKKPLNKETIVTKPKLYKPEKQNILEKGRDYLKRKTGSMNPTKICVIGTGGAGNNAIKDMMDRKIEGVSYISANTDVSDLSFKGAKNRLQLGAKCTKGLGAGGNPDVGARAAEESAFAIKDAISDYDMVIIVAGMGGGTGSGSAPVIARIAKQAGVLALAVVTMPFAFEGKVRARNAQIAKNKVIENADATICLPNDRLLHFMDDGDEQKKLSIADAFKRSDDELANAVDSICRLILMNGMISLDFADIRTVLQNNYSVILMSTGSATGPNRADEAVDKALNNKLQDVEIENAASVIVGFFGQNLSLGEIDATMAKISDRCDPDANIMFGVYEDDTLGEQIQVSIVIA